MQAMIPKPCPRCGAAGTEPCRTAGGHEATAWHKVRLEVVRRPGELEAWVEASIASAEWLRPSDQAAAALALVQARDLDDAIWKAELRARAPKDRELLSLFPELEHTSPALGNDGAIAYAAATLLQTLGPLGLTPLGRKTLGIQEESREDASLATIRALAAVDV